MDNWYEILGVPENIEPDELLAELERLRDKAQREHHPDQHRHDLPAERDWHAEQLKRVLDGVSFLETKHGPKILKEHLRQQRAAQAAAEAERVRSRNAEEAKRRGDADDLRAQFGSRPRPASGTRSSDTTPPRRPSPPRPGSGLRPPPHRPTPSRPPVKVRHSPRSEAGVVLALDEFPPVDWGAVAGRVIGLVAALALLALPIYIMIATTAASNDQLHEDGLVELGCFALLIVGLAAVACALGAIFSRD
jgi:hypothetical protein